MTAVRHAPALETVNEPSAFAALADEWDELVRAMSRPSPYMLHGWLTTWWRHHGGRGELRVHVAREGDRLAAALPLYVSRRAGVRVLRFVGADTSALGDVLLAPDASPALAGRLLEMTTGDGHDVADLFGLPTGSRLAAAAGDRLRLVPRVEAPVLDLDRDWDEIYRAKMSTKRRGLDRRRRRRLAEVGELTVDVARTLDALEPALEAAFELHAARWQDRPEASGFATPAGRDFQRDALRELAAVGAPQIVLVRVGGRPVACNYSLVVADRIFLHEQAFHPDFARFAPGHLCTLETLAAASGAGIRRVEFLGGAERYKLELADRFEPLHQGIGLAASARGRATASLRIESVHLRRRLKQTAIRTVYYDHLAPARRAMRWLRS